MAMARTTSVWRTERVPQAQLPGQFRVEQGEFVDGVIEWSDRVVACTLSWSADEDGDYALCLDDEEWFAGFQDGVYWHYDPDEMPPSNGVNFHCMRVATTPVWRRSAVPFLLLPGRFLVQHGKFLDGEIQWHIRMVMSDLSWSPDGDGALRAEDEEWQLFAGFADGVYWEQDPIAIPPSNESNRWCMRVAT
jgi:hypothetical protein